VCATDRAERRRFRAHAAAAPRHSESCYSVSFPLKLVQGHPIDPATHSAEVDGMLLSDTAGMLNAGMDVGAKVYSSAEPVSEGV
jgi:hypothetical protein